MNPSRLRRSGRLAGPANPLPRRHRAACRAPQTVMICAHPGAPSAACPMHVLYVHANFSTARGSWGTRAYDFARRWSELGHTVTVGHGSLRQVRSAPDSPAMDRGHRRHHGSRAERPILQPRRLHAACRHDPVARYIRGLARRAALLRCRTRLLRADSPRRGRTRGALAAASYRRRRGPRPVLRRPGAASHRHPPGRPCRTARMRSRLLPQRARRRHPLRHDEAVGPAAPPSPACCGRPQYRRRGAVRARLCPSCRDARPRREELRVHRHAGASQRLRPVAPGRPLPEVMVAIRHPHPSRRRRIGTPRAGSRGRRAPASIACISCRRCRERRLPDGSARRRR